MPPKLTVNDYTFYIVPDPEGKYIFGLENAIQGHIYRRPKSDFKKWAKISTEFEKTMIVLFGSANIQDAKTGKYLLVYEIFPDFQEEAK